jgi:hypothetical protein
LGTRANQVRRYLDPPLAGRLVQGGTAPVVSRVEICARRQEHLDDLDVSRSRGIMERDVTRTIPGVYPRAGGDQ